MIPHVPRPVRVAQRWWRRNVQFMWHAWSILWRRRRGHLWPLRRTPMWMVRMIRMTLSRSADMDFIELYDQAVDEVLFRQAEDRVMSAVSDYVRAEHRDGV